MEKIKENIYVETGFLGCNPGFVVTSNGIVMIDTPQKPREAFQWRKEIHKHGEIAYLINTDHHRDHALGNFFFDGNLIQHEGTMKELMTEAQLEFDKKWFPLIEPESGSIPEHYFRRRPTVTFTDRMTLYVGAEVFELIHIVSHTRDETLVYLPQKKILFTGDTVCTMGLPSVNESYPLKWLEALKMLKTLDIDVLVPGHGAMGNKDSIGKFERDLLALFKRVEEKIVKGFSREDIIREESYDDIVHSKYPPAVSEFFKNGMKLNMGRLYDELSKK